MSSFDSNPNQFKRNPVVRVLVEDLVPSRWNEEEKIIESRYGTIKRVRLCGTVVNRRETQQEPSSDSFLENENAANSRVSFLIDDGTGHLWATVWAATVEDFQHIKTGDVVDVIGIGRKYKNQPQINVEIIHKLTDPNFETYHLIDVLRKRKLEPSFEVKEPTIQNFDDFDLDLPQEDFTKSSSSGQEDVFIQEFEADKSPAQEAAPPSTPTKKASLDTPDQIVEYITEKDMGDGVPIAEISQAVGVDKADLKGILEQLCQDVKIYKVQPGYYSSY